MKVRKKFSPSEATKVAADIAAGLDYAFQRGISHRDLKLTNVLLSSRGQAKLVDFGLAGADEKLADESITGETLETREPSTTRGSNAPPVPARTMPAATSTSSAASIITCCRACRRCRKRVIASSGCRNQGSRASCRSTRPVPAFRASWPRW